ncbi:S8 family serine peptidase [Marinihelvus fidelis]|nr:S8 family serine peptidase [Marinihelvus fidelis]
MKDVIVDAPAAVREASLEGDMAGKLAGAAVASVSAGGENLPEDLLFNLPMMGADVMFGAGFMGDGAITAIIDSGTVAHGSFLRGGCQSAEPTLLGGETWIGGADPTEPSATSPLNGNHGSEVGTVIAANALYSWPTGHIVPQVISTHAPGSIIPNGATQLMPMIGVAPCSHLYALKVFSAFGGGAPTSDVVAAMERAIDLKLNFDAGMPSVPVSGSGAPEDPFVYDSLNITTVNMSLGGATLFATQDFDDLLTEAMVDAGITLVNSAGNEGHSAMTGGSAGTGRGSLTAGAASTAAHERIYVDLFLANGFGTLYRASEHTQTATFSSRGPSADGRISTDAVANGDSIWMGGANGGCCLIGSGTSFSAPQIAGASALLHAAFPDATGEEVRNALVYSANPNLLGDNSGPIDQGNGFIDIPAAYTMLATDSVPAGLPTGAAGASVTDNIEALGFEVISIGNGGSYTVTLEDLAPGQVGHIFLASHKNTEQFSISLSNLSPALPPGQQNQLFGDDLFVHVQDAITSDEAVIASGFINADTVLTVDNPQSGIVRVGIMGDWTNAGTISVDVEITEVRGSGGPKLAGGKVAHGGFDGYLVNIPAGLGSATFELSWNNDWGSFPTDDLDLVLWNAVYGFNFDGATFASPERATLVAPEPGIWEVYVDGFTVWGVHGGPRSKYQLHAWDQDGNAL